jgi:hypothetical protein
MALVDVVQLGGGVNRVAWKFPSSNLRLGTQLIVKSGRRCCTTLTLQDSHRESTRLDRSHEQAITPTLPHHELVQLHCGASQEGFIADVAGQGDDLARAA